MAKTNKNKKDIKKRIMKGIKKNEIKMRPKIYFAIGSLFLILGVILSVILTSVFLHSFVFGIRRFAPFSYFRMGFPGFRPFFLTFPWISLVVCILSIYFGITLLKKYDISYKNKFSSLAIGLVVIIILGVFFLLRINFSNRVNKVKGLRVFYKNELRHNIPTPPPPRRMPGLRFHLR